MMKYLNLIIDHDEDIIRNSLRHLKTVFKFMYIKCIVNGKWVDDRIIDVVIEDSSVYYITGTGLKLRSFEFIAK